MPIGKLKQGIQPSRRNLARLCLIRSIVIVALLRRWARKRQAATGLAFPVFRVSLAILLGLPFLAWLAGGRIMELKTVQVQDDLDIPRPCIHVPNVGFNVEWSQELRVADFFSSLALKIPAVITTSFSSSMVRSW